LRTWPIDARKLYLGAGFPSLFTYCCEILRLSEAEAYNRIEVARAAQKFPVILDLLSQASLNLTTARLLSPHLTSQNHQELLAAASGRSRREVEELLAARFPRPDVPSSIRKLPAPRPNPIATTLLAKPADAVSPPPAIAALQPASVEATPVVSAVSCRPPRRPLVTPLATDRYAIQFTVNTETRDKLRLAQDLLRHAIPSGDTAEIFDRALDLLLADLARKKFGATSRPRKNLEPAAPLRGLLGETGVRESSPIYGASSMSQLVPERVGRGERPRPHPA
jgi:hypothetical protein